MLASGKVRALCATASTLALVTSLVSLPQAVRAADASDSSKESGGGTKIGEIVVTAQKREQNLQTVPVAITAFTAAERDRAGIVSAQDQMNFTPGVTYDPQSDHLDIRGVGKVTTYIGTDPGVAVYTDGFYVGSAANLNTTTLETERVEVLRGPQGTLYGRNSIGGAVNQISRRPDNEFTGEIRASANNWNGYTVEARVSGPITDWLKASAYFEGNDQTGYYNHVVAPHTAPAAGPTLGNSTVPPTPAYPAATCSSLNFATVQPLTCQSFNGSFPGTGGVGNGWIGSFQAAYNPSPQFDGWVNARFTNQFSRPGQASITTPWNPIALTVPSVFYGFQGIQQPGLYDPRASTYNIPTTENYDFQKFVTQDNYHAPGLRREVHRRLLGLQRQVHSGRRRRSGSSLRGVPADLCGLERRRAIPVSDHQPEGSAEHGHRPQPAQQRVPDAIPGVEHRTRLRFDRRREVAMVGWRLLLQRT